MGPMIMEKARAARDVFVRIVRLVCRKACGWEVWPDDDGAEGEGGDGDGEASKKPGSSSKVVAMA